MYLTKDRFRKIMEQNDSNVVIDDDVQGAFGFVLDVMDAELDEMQEKAPYAYHSIHDLEAAISVLLNMMDEIGNEVFGE